MQKQLSVAGALHLFLQQEHRSPIVSLYDIAVATVRLYINRQYGDQKIKNIRALFPKRANVTRHRNELLELGILTEPRDFPSNIYLLASSPFKDLTDLACGVDPFAYASHLSAMEYHGLTDRFAMTAFLSTLPAPQWRLRAQERMRKDIGEDLLDQYAQASLPGLVRHSINSLGRKPVHILATKVADQGAYIVPQDRPIRVASIGRTFLDMLRKPELCGGINHVLDVFTEHAETYLSLILKEIDRHGEPIDKVRAGYVLEERIGIKNNPIIDGWAKFAQRGGSRMLDPATEYWPVFSEKWCISINVAA